VVGLLGSLFHAVPCVFGRALCFVPRVLHILFCAAVLARGGLLTPSKSRSTPQRGTNK
jgi:flagellar biosynthesis protein FliQ